MSIDKSIGTPYYIQISDYITKQIEDGVYMNRQMMPSEQEMQEKFDVSRITIRKAYKILAEKGLLTSIKGKGTFVNVLEERDWTNMKSFTEDVLNSGHVPSTKIVDFKIIKATADIASNLNVRIGTKCYYLNRMRSIDNKTIWLTKTYILCDIANGLTKEYFSEKGVGQSIFRVLEANFGLKFKAGPTMSIQNQVSEQDAVLLKIDRSKPIICKAMIVTDDKMRVIIYENTIFDQSITYHI